MLALSIIYDLKCWIFLSIFRVFFRATFFIFTAALIPVVRLLCRFLMFRLRFCFSFKWFLIGNYVVPHFFLRFLWYDVPFCPLVWYVQMLVTINSNVLTKSSLIPKEKQFMMYTPYIWRPYEDQTIFYQWQQIVFRLLCPFAFKREKAFLYIFRHNVQRYRTDNKQINRYKCTKSCWFWLVATTCIMGEYPVQFSWLGSWMINIIWMETLIQYGTYYSRVQRLN